MNPDITTIQFHNFYAFLLIFARMSGVLVTAPVLGNKAIPKQAKAGLAFVLSLSLTPMLQARVGKIPDHILVLGGEIVAEALLGLSLGYVGKLLFAAIEMAGYFVDTQIGFGFMNLIDPFSEQQTSVLSVFQFQLALTLYLLMNGHLLLIQAVVQSFEAVLPGAVSLTGHFGMSIAPMLPHVFALGFQLALPAVGVLVVMDVAFGLIARLAPQVNVFQVGAPVKIIIGLTTVAITLPALTTIIEQVIGGNLAGMKALLK